MASIATTPTTPGATNVPTPKPGTNPVDVKWLVAWAALWLVLLAMRQAGQGGKDFADVLAVTIATSATLVLLPKATEHLKGLTG